MSYRNKVIALSSALAILLLVYAGGLILSPERMSAKAESGRLIAGKLSEIASFTIGAEAGEEKLEFVKESSSWSILDSGQNLPVLDSKVESFIASVAGIERLSPRSEGKATALGFGLDGGQGRRVVIRSGGGKVLADFTVGGYGPTGSEVYVRLGGKGTIYAVDAVFSSFMEAGRASWLNLKVFAVPIKPDEVEGIAIEALLPLDGAAKPATKASWSAARKDGGWTGPKGAYEAVLVESVLRSVLNLEGQDISAMPPRDAFSPSLGRVELSLGSGAKRVLEIGKDAGGERLYVRAQGSPWVFMVSTYSLKNIARPVESLVKK